MVRMANESCVSSFKIKRTNKQVKRLEELSYFKEKLNKFSANLQKNSFEKIYCRYKLL